MSSELEALRAEAGARKPRSVVCALCNAEAAEVSLTVTIRERGASGTYLAGRGVRACTRCSLAFMERLSQDGGAA